MVRRSKGTTQTLPQSRASQDQPADKGTFENFFRANYRPLLRVAGYAGASTEEAEDAVQQAMIEVSRHWHRLDDPWPWACRAVVNNYRKVRKREAQRLARTANGGHVTPAGYDDTALTVWEDQQWIDQMLSRLPPVQRQVMAFVVEQWRPAELAQMLGKTDATVRQNLKLARDRLKQELQNEREQEQEQVATPVSRPTTREEVK